MLYIREAALIQGVPYINIQYTRIVCIVVFVGLYTCVQGFLFIFYQNVERGWKIGRCNRRFYANHQILINDCSTYTQYIQQNLSCTKSHTSSSSHSAPGWGGRDSEREKMRERKRAQQKAKGYFKGSLTPSSSISLTHITHLTLRVFHYNTTTTILLLRRRRFLLQQQQNFI